eukprot:CAMPEP_0170551318 /NCGR_PEP_ID=MMETSP0211-20121228/9337_1 /TAXON_ID=311385 /ORGANISM="Pseudokeronopsis sp., Strain OXSARD2" /LENGTH=171 /DNA_ID=CAMNT_0010858417 /DNA_START=145 /DNA_END=660 /DNA_ORIENTATION=-
MPFGITTNCRLFDLLNVKNITFINFYDVFLAILWTSYALRLQKVDFAFRMMDADNTNQIKFEELHEIIKWSLKGVGKVFSIKMPKSKEIQIVSYKSFVSANASNNVNLDFTELVNWIELNQVFISFLNDYEPSNPTKYDLALFEKFIKFDVNTLEDEPLAIKSNPNRLLNA